MVGGGPEWHRCNMALGRRGRASSVMACAHDGFHAIRTSYDRRSGVLVYFWACEWGHSGGLPRDSRVGLAGQCG